MREARSLVERQGINVANRKAVPHIEAGAGPVRGDVIGVDERRVKPVRGVVDRVAVSVGSAQSEVANRAPGGTLKRVVDGIRGVFQPGDVAEPGERSVRVGVVSTCNPKICGRQPDDGGSPLPDGEGTAVTCVLNGTQVTAVPSPSGKGEPPSSGWR